ncbi:MAG TPA: EamA family transporter [Gaiellaceae bacterium]|nr:EamA family transporter [Gaiellaceae bacterium]
MPVNAEMTRRGWLLFASMCVIWGIPYLLIRVAVRDLSPAMLVLGRTGVGALLLLPLAAARGEVAPVLRRWRGVLLFSAVEIAVPWLLLSDAEVRLSSSLTGLLIAAVPLVGALIVRERLGPASAAGLALGVVGVGALVGLDVGGANARSLAEIAVVVVCYAAGPIVLARYLSDLPSLGVIAVSLGAAALVYVPLGALSAPAELPSGKVLASVLGLAVVCTALAFLVFFALIAEIGPVRATVITYVNPAVAALLGVAVLGETFTAGMGVGFALILAGSLLATRPARAAPVEPEPAR